MSFLKKESSSISKKILCQT